MRLVISQCCSATVFATDQEKRPLELIHMTSAASGVLRCVYRPGPRPPTPPWEG